jgi:hypothetical protein
MTIAKEIDLVSELEKAKANVAMLENILAIEKQKDEQQILMSKNQAAVESLSTNVQAVKTELDNLKADLTKNEEEHRAKTKEWRAKDNKVQRVMFDADVASNDSYENQEDLEGAAQLAEENAALFRQKLVLRQSSSEIKFKGYSITALESSLSKKKELQLILENQLKKSTDDFYKGREKYQQKLQADLNSSSIAISLGSQVKCLKLDVMDKEGTTKEQNMRIVDAEAFVKSKDDTTDSHQATIAPFCSESEPPVPTGDRAVDIQVQQAYKRGRNAAFNQLGPLTTAGQYIRGRKLEWESDNKNQKLVELGNKASHYGMALADATLYQSFCPNKRKDPGLYTAFYGLHPDFIWKNQKCTLLLDILDWRGAMKDFYPPFSSHRTTYPETTFSKLCNKFMASIEAELTTWTVASLNKYLKDNEKGVQMYKDLMAHHAAGLKMHETNLKSK